MFGKVLLDLVDHLQCPERRTTDHNCPERSTDRDFAARSTDREKLGQGILSLYSPSRPCRYCDYSHKHNKYVFLNVNLIG